MLGVVSTIPFSEFSARSSSGASSSLVPKISLNTISIADKLAWELVREKVALGPYYAVYRLAWSTSDGADRERFRCFFRGAVVAFGFALR